ncbi:hypothetical protein [Tenacibaculum discolor]|nr:hypothetical protein [Tenacibaculum discolor]
MIIIFTLVLILNRVIMKKVTLILAVVFSTFLLTSCTDESKELEELNNESLEVYNVDRKDIERPGSQGSN